MPTLLKTKQLWPHSKLTFKLLTPASLPTVSTLSKDGYLRMPGSTTQVHSCSTAGKVILQPKLMGVTSGKEPTSHYLTISHPSLMTRSARMQTFHTVFTRDLSLLTMYPLTVCSMGKPTWTRFLKTGMALSTPTYLNNQMMYFLTKIHTTSTRLLTAFSFHQLWINQQSACSMTACSQSIISNTPKQSNIPLLCSIFKFIMVSGLVDLMLASRSTYPSLSIVPTAGTVFKLLSRFKQVTTSKSKAITGFGKLQTQHMQSKFNLILVLWAKCTKTQLWSCSLSTTQTALKPCNHQDTSPSPSQTWLLLSEFNSQFMTWPTKSQQIKPLSSIKLVILQITPPRSGLPQSGWLLCALYSLFLV